MDNTLNIIGDQQMEDQLMELLSADDSVLEMALRSGQIDAITDSIYSEANLQRQLAEFKEKGMTKADVLQQVEEFRNSIREMEESMSFGGGEDYLTKITVVQKLLSPGVEFLERVAARYQLADCKIKIELSDGARMPTRAHEGDAGLDIYAIEDTVLPAHRGTKLRTGIKVSIPQGWVLSVRPRSGISLNTKMRVANAPGTVDASYHQEVGIIVDNIGDDDIQIAEGARIAQFVLERVYQVEFEQVEDLEQAVAIEGVASRANEKGEQGFGSSGR